MKLIYKIQIGLLGIFVASPSLYPTVRSWIGLTPGEYYSAAPVFAGLGIIGLAAWVKQHFELKKDIPQRIAIVKNDNNRNNSSSCGGDRTNNNRITNLTSSV